MYKIFTLAAATALIPLARQHNDTQNLQSTINTASFKLPLQFLINNNNTVTLTQPAKPQPEQAWSQNWLGQAQDYIRKSEYNFVWEEKYGAYCTPNRKNNLRFFYTHKGFTVEPGTTKIPIGAYDARKQPEEIKYRNIANWKINFDLDTTLLHKGEWHIQENKAEYKTDSLTVQYINNDEGMRQNFIVQSPLTNNNTLQIKFSIKTKLKTFLHGNQLQFFHKKINVLNYDQLKVWDATGKPLDAAIKKNINQHYCIEVNTKNAVYPITIDPISTIPDNTPDDANQSNALFGCSIASAGDVNGDGYSDVIIGALNYNDGANSFEGRAFVYYGSSTGLPVSPNNTPDDADQPNARFGNSVSSAGDVNGDGYSDVIIGASYFKDGINTNEGRAFIYYGSAAGLAASPGSTPDDADQANAYFGQSVSCAGDVNGDGYSDVIIGAYFYDEGANVDEGRAFVYHGSATGLSASPDSTPDDADQPGAYFGQSVSSAGDVNGDGYSDVIIGADFYNDGTNADEGRAFVYHGSATGLSASPNSTPDDANQASAYFGNSVSCAGDVNGDGYSDVIIGGPGYDDVANTNEGRAFVYHGSATGLSASPNSTPDDADQLGASLGNSVAAAGDINGDGYSDVIIGAQFADDGATVDEGLAYIYYGSSTGLLAIPSSILDDSNQAGGQFGNSVASAGDVNGDGYSDVIIGAFQYDDGTNTNEGRAFVYHGSAAGLSATPGSTPDDADQAGAVFGSSVASAGDVNRDGYSDVIIGAPNFSAQGRAFVYHGAATGLAATPNNVIDDGVTANAKFGNSVASAGDVNGDGYSDVIIGAPLHNVGANNSEGRVFVHYGSALGITATPASIINDANQTNAAFGLSVAGAGDVNGDGFSDVIIGAPDYNDGANNSEGRVYIHHGSATGLSALPNNTPNDANQANADFGRSVAGAGDVNGDGYSDVIIGAPFFNDGANNLEGRAFVYYGSVTGISATPNSMPDDANIAAANLGTSVASAGDVNGDGYSDVIIGAPFFNDGANTGEGRAYLYQGSAAGLSPSPTSTLDALNQSNANFGYSVSSAGDVNGDGYNDVIIGARSYTDGANVNEGRAFVYHGSAAGLSPSPISTLDALNQSNANFGYSVSSTGDVDGDGYSDIIIGATGFKDGANINEGRAFLFNGNEFFSNKRNNLRLYNTDLTTPVNSSNVLFTDFGAGLFAKSFLGSCKGKMVCETRLSYQAYSGTPITNSTTYTTQQAALSSLTLIGKELKMLVHKIAAGSGVFTKVRARVKYDLVTAITGQVYGPWRNVSDIIDGNKQGILPVEIISFNTIWQQKGKTAQINFTTDKEAGTCCFDIEKSADGFTFNTIGIIAAKNISGRQLYNYIDNNASAKKQFYRLKVKGINGEIIYSSILLLENNIVTEIFLFPNPATDFLQLQLNKGYSKLSITVVNAKGQMVKQVNKLATTNQTITIPVNNLPPGNYWLHLQADVEKQVLQFIKH